MQWPKRKWLNDEVEQAVLEVIAYYKESGEDLPTQSYFENQYCDNFVRFQEVEGYADAVNSGTSAVYVALAALGVKESDQVITSPVTDFGTISAMALHHLKIKVVDAKEGSFNTSLTEITNTLSTEDKGLLLTHTSGDPIEEIEEIATLCKEKGIWLIEDCSQAHGAVVSGKKVGTFGDIAIFSTMHSKNHSTGGAGGILYTKSQEIYNKIRSHADRGKQFNQNGFDSKNPECIGYPALNFNSDEISCAIGNVNLNKLNHVIFKRRKFLQSLEQRLKEENLPLALKMNVSSCSPYFCPIVVTDSTVNIPVFKKNLSGLNFPSNNHYSFIVKEWGWAKTYVNEKNSTPNAIDFRNRSFNLLFNENFSINEENRIITLLKEALVNAI